MTVDTVSPSLTAVPVFQFQTTQSVTYGFSENVSGALSGVNVVVQNITTVTTLAEATKLVAYNAGTNTATLSFAGFPGARLADGNFRNTIAAAGVTSPATRSRPRRSSTSSSPPATSTATAA